MTRIVLETVAKMKVHKQVCSLKVSDLLVAPQEEMGLPSAPERRMPEEGVRGAVQGHTRVNKIFLFCFSILESGYKLGCRDH